MKGRQTPGLFAREWVFCGQRHGSGRLPRTQRNVQRRDRAEGAKASHPHSMEARHTRCSACAHGHARPGQLRERRDSQERGAVAEPLRSASMLVNTASVLATRIQTDRPCEATLDEHQDGKSEPKASRTLQAPVTTIPCGGRKCETCWRHQIVQSRMLPPWSFEYSVPWSTALRTRRLSSAAEAARCPRGAHQERGPPGQRRCPGRRRLGRESARFGSKFGPHLHLEPTGRHRWQDRTRRAGIPPSGRCRLARRRRVRTHGR